jgi:diguanylate cyclase (GGDEF)-like protein
VSANSLHAHRALGALSTEVLRELPNLANTTSAAIFFADDQGTLSLFDGMGLPDRADGTSFSSNAPLGKKLLTGATVRQGDSGAGLLNDVSAAVAIPLCHNGKLLGALAISPAPQDGSESNILDTYATMIASSTAAIMDLQTAGSLAVNAANERAEVALDAARVFSSTTTTNTLMRHILAEAISAVKGTKGSLMLLDADGMLAVRVVFGLPDKIVENKINRGEIVCAKFLPGQGVAGKVFESCRAQRINDVSNSDNFSQKSGTYANSILCVPVPTEDDVLGVLNITNSRDGAFSEQDQETLVEIAVQAGAAIERTKTIDALLQDDLTSTYMGPFVERRIDEEIVRCARYSKELCVMALTIDGLYDLRADYGDELADTICAEIGAIVSDQLRSQIDMVGHFGDGWFELLLPETKPEGAVILGKRLQGAVDELMVETPQGDCFQVSVSFATGAPKPDDNCRTLLRRIDTALTQAIEEGGTRVAAMLSANA